MAKAKAQKISILDLVIRPIEGIGYGSVIVDYFCTSLVRVSLEGG